MGAAYPKKFVKKERERLHGLAKDLVLWGNTPNEPLLGRTSLELKPGFHLLR